MESQGSVCGVEQSRLEGAGTPRAPGAAEGSVSPWAPKEAPEEAPSAAPLSVHVSVSFCDSQLNMMVQTKLA